MICSEVAFRISRQNRIRIPFKHFLLPILVLTAIAMITVQVKPVAQEDEKPHIEALSDLTVFKEKHLKVSASHLVKTLQYSPLHPKLIVRNEDFDLYNNLGKYLHALEEECLEPFGVECSKVRPENILIISSWRSGSTFLSELLQSHPGTFLHYEPLMSFSSSLLNTNQEAEVKERLYNLFSCDYDQLVSYIRYAQVNPDQLFHNVRLTAFCDSKKFKTFCYRPDVLTSICSALKIRVIKVVRFRVKDAVQLVKDSNMPNLKILYLVRDPRGTMNSRKLLTWCTDPACSSAKIYCANLESDFYNIQILMKTHPGLIKIVYFEDLTSQTVLESTKILKFLDLNLHNKVLNFLNNNSANETLALKWQESLKFPELKSIESYCKNALKLWGYK